MTLDEEARGLLRTLANALEIELESCSAQAKAAAGVLSADWSEPDYHNWCRGLVEQARRAVL